MNKDTQRWAETELIELIANLIASYSHHNELYNSLQSDLLHLELYTEEQKEQMLKDSIWHYTKLIELLEERRLAMRKLKELAIECDGKMRCLVKHSIAAYQFSQEILNTDMDNLDYIHLSETAYRYMYECISKFLWVELVTCARCLADELDLQNKNKTDEEEHIWKSDRHL